MKFRDFKDVDPDLAERLLQVEQYNAEVSEWHQAVRDQIQRRLDVLGKGEPEIVYQDVRCTTYRSLLDQAAEIDDPILNPLVAELKDPILYAPSNVVLDEIYIKHGLTVGIGIEDCENLEDTFEFITP